MPQQPYILGIDIGTGSTKAVAVNLHGKAIAVSQFHYPAKILKLGYHEQEPALIWNAFINCIRDIVSQLQYPPHTIGLSSVMHSIIPADGQGNELADMITWADCRSSQVADRIHKSPVGEYLYQTTGTPLHSMSPLNKIIWLRENDPELFARTQRFISIKEYIWHRLFQVFEVDHSLASATGLFDIIRLSWCQEALELAGITESLLSKPVRVSHLRTDIDPETAAILGIPAATRFVIGASDGCMANLGSFSTKQGIAALTIGTSGALRLASKNPVYNYKAMTFNYILDDNTFICGGPVNNGGVAVQWLIRNFMDKEAIDVNDYAELFRLIGTVEPGSNGLLFLPYLTGERAPIWDSESCGTFFGIRAHHRKSHFLRAALEGICYALNDVLRSVEESSDAIVQLNVSGGFIFSKIWMQLLADISGKKLVLVQENDASAMGAAYLCMKVSGLIKDYTVLQDGQTREVIEPIAVNHELYRRYFPVFKKLYPDLKESMHQLNQLNSDGDFNT